MGSRFLPKRNSSNGNEIRRAVSCSHSKPFPFLAPRRAVSSPHSKPFPFLARKEILFGPYHLWCASLLPDGYEIKTWPRVGMIVIRHMAIVDRYKRMSRIMYTLAIIQLIGISCLKYNWIRKLNSSHLHLHLSYLLPFQFRFLIPFLTPLCSLSARRLLTLKRSNRCE